MKLKSIVLLAATVLMSSPVWAISASLKRAQDSFRKGQFQNAIFEIKNAFMSERLSKAEQSNLTALFAAIDHATRSNIDLGWELPAGVEVAKVRGEKVDDFRRSGDYRLTVMLRTPEKDTIKQVQVKKYPDLVVFDLAAGIGNNSLEDQGGTGWQLHMKSQRSSLPAPSGAYLIRIETKSGQVTNGWFMLSDEDTPSKTPELVGFKPAPTFDTGTPVIEWKNFFSPEYKTNEKRNLDVAVYTESENDWDPRFEYWDFDSGNPTKTSLDLGKDISSGANKVPLTDGNYLVYVKYHEIKKMKPLYVGRIARVIREFNVKIRN